MVVFPYGVDFLLQDENDVDFPIYAPQILFRICDYVSVSSWFSGEVSTAHGVVPIFGYREWAQDQSHFEGVLERRLKDLELFKRRAKALSG
jgi:hypothetical protein